MIPVQMKKSRWSSKVEQLNLGTFEAYSVPVLRFPCSLGTFDGLFVPKFSFSVWIHSFGHG